MFEIVFTREINAPIATVWHVIVDTAAYPHWNPFITECESTFELGSKIRMRVNFGSSERIQTEYISANRAPELLAYGMKPIPFLLASTRQHRLAALDDATTKYESYFQLRGALAPAVKLSLGKKMLRGFSQMTDGIARQAELRHQEKN
ncbi:MAG: SRPBCC domain-containing protein [Pseudomonadales bacterium]